MVHYADKKLFYQNVRVPDEHRRLATHRRDPENPGLGGCDGYQQCGFGCCRHVFGTPDGGRPRFRIVFGD